MSDIVEQDILKKRKDDQEELPVLTAQRFLNIFRQIHIFSEKKQKEFDEELRKLPSEVIMAMRGLPGAKLLLEHLDELKGISSVNDAISSATTASREAEEEIENAHQNIRMPFFQQQPVMQPMPVDNNFAEALSSSLAGAIERIENKRSAEIKSMLASVLTTQKAILDAQRNTLAPAVAPTSVSVDTGQIAQVLKDVIENQSKMFSDMIDSQTKTISNIVATSIKEQKPVIVEKPVYYQQPQAPEPIAPAAPAEPLSEPISAIEDIKDIAVKRIFFNRDVAHSDASCRNSRNRAVIIIFKHNVVVKIPQIVGACRSCILLRRSRCLRRSGISASGI